jgi:hypothetical protein
LSNIAFSETIICSIYLLDRHASRLGVSAHLADHFAMFRSDHPAGDWAA